MKFEVEGMSCNHCVAAITKAVQTVDPAAKVSADVPAQQVSVESGAPAQALREAIEAAGYPVRAAA